jgi:hypothetical protein
MSRETKRTRRGSGRTSRPSNAGASSPQGSGSSGCLRNATDSESPKDPPAETQSTAAAAKALARWENEGGRVVEAGQGGRPLE